MARVYKSRRDACVPRSRYRRGFGLWPKSLSILNRSNERLDHFSADEVAVELVQLVQPKLVAGVVYILRIVGIAAQVTKELHQHKRAIELLLLQNGVFSYVAQRTPSRRRVAR